MGSMGHCSRVGAGTIKGSKALDSLRLLDLSLGILVPTPVPVVGSPTRPEVEALRFRDLLLLGVVGPTSVTGSSVGGC